MRIFLLAPNYKGMGGFQVQLAALAKGLVAAGQQVSVYILEPVNRLHPYWQQMAVAGVWLYSPPGWVARMPPIRWRLALATGLASVVAVVLLPFILIDAIRRGRSIGRSWQGAVGAIVGRLSGLIEFDLPRWWMQRQLATDIRQARPDVIDIQHSMLPWGIEYGKQHGLPVVYTEYGAPSEDLLSIWIGLRGVINKADFVIARSNASISGLQRLCEMDRPYTIVHNAVVASPDGRPPPLPGVESVITIAAIGRLSPEKGPQFLLEAFKKLIDDGLPVKLVFAGDGPLREELETRAKQWGLESHVLFTGVFDDLAPIMNATHIVAHPTLNDGRSVSVLEAMAWGRPIVATQIGGIPELIEDGISGLLVPPSNADAMATALKRMVLSPELREQTARAAYAKFIDGSYTTDAMVAATLKIYKQVVSS